MILAGVDEAGYGPVLGPLVVGCCAFEVDAENPDELPCLWKRLKKIASRNKGKTGRKLHINDSKLVYSPAGGLKELEKSILALAETCFSNCSTLESFVQCVADHVSSDLREYVWYQSELDDSFPLEQEAVSIRIFGNALKQEMHKNGTRCVHLAARVVPEKQLNRLLDQTHNKGSALFSIAAIHLDHLLRTYGERNLVIFCDRQGGREHYGQLLRLMFEEWALEIVAEDEGFCDYRLTRNGHCVRLVFCEKAETKCMSVAVASMLSKYLREALMRRFNAYWKKMLPELEPTAGYYNDGLRFLKDIEHKRLELGIRDAELIRSR